VADQYAEEVEFMGMSASLLKTDLSYVQLCLMSAHMRLTSRQKVPIRSFNTLICPAVRRVLHTCVKAPNDEPIPAVPGSENNAGFREYCYACLNIIDADVPFSFVSAERSGISRPASPLLLTIHVLARVRNQRAAVLRATVSHFTSRLP